MANPDIIISPGNGSIGFSGSLAGDSNSSKLLVGSNGDLHMRGSDMFISGNLTVSGDITSSSASHQATSYTASTHVSGLSGYFGKVGIGTTNMGAAPDALTVGALVAGNTKTVQFNSEGGTEIGLKVMSRTNRAVLKVGDNDTNSYIASENSTSSFGPAAELSSSNINIFGGGKVGIGTILSNGALLTVNGDASISGELKTKTPLKVEAASPTSNAHYFRMSYDNSVGILDANRGKLRLQANDGVIYTDGDSIGIGTSNPSSTLHLKKSSGTTTVLAEVAANSTIGFEIKKTGSTTQHWKIVDGQTVNGRLEFYDATDSATRMIIDGDGNVGIGTISPSSRLQIFGNSAGTAKLQIEGEGGADPYINFLVNNTTHWSIGADDNDSDSFKISNHSALGTNDRLTIDSDGYLGLGTTTPDARLQVNGDASITGELRVNRSGLFVGGGGGANIDDYVGIGTINPNRPLTIYHPTENVLLELHSNDADVTLSLRDGDAAGSAYVGVGGRGNDLKFLAGGYIRGTIKSDGKFGIGTESPQALLQVDGDASITGELRTNGSIGVGVAPAHKLSLLDSAVGAFINPRNSQTRVDMGAYTDHDLALYAGENERVRIEKDGNVGIGTGNPAGKLDIIGSNGTVTATPDGDAEELVIRNNDRAGIQIFSADSAYGSLIFGSASDANGANIFYAPGDKLLTIGTQVANGEVSLRSANGAAAVRIDADGKVGIGTTNPAELLTVSGANPTVRINNPNTAGSDTAAYTFGFDANVDIAGMRIDHSDRIASGLALFVHPAYGYPISVTPSPSKDILLNVMDGGGVGIGTTAPGYSLDVNAAGSQTIRVKSTNNHAAVRIDRPSDSYDGNLMFQTNGTTKWRLAQGVVVPGDNYLSIYDDINDVGHTTFEAGGNVGIGTAIPQAKLHVNGDASISGELNVDENITVSANVIANNYFANNYVYHNSDVDCYFGFLSNDHIVFRTAGTDRVLIDDAGHTSITGDLRVKQTARLGYGGVGQSDTVGGGSNVMAHLGDGNFVVRQGLGGGYIAFDAYFGGWNQLLSLSRHDGAVGIGITGGFAGSKLAVNGDASITGQFRTAGNASIGGVAPLSNVALILNQASSDFILGLYRAGTAEWFQKVYTDGRFALHENGVGDLFTIKAGGNVGIGTTNPGKLLTVYADSPIIGLYSSYADSNTRNWAISTNNSNYGDFTLSNSAAKGGDPNVIKVTVLKDGNVGIGTDDPTQKIHVYVGNASAPTDSNTHAVIEDSDHSYLGIYGGSSSDVGIHFGDSAIDARIKYENDTRALKFAAAGTADQLTIDSVATQVTGDLRVAQYIRHGGDADTHINFTDDDINFKVGNVNFLDLTQDTVSEMTINEAGANLDVRIEGDTDANLFFTDASTNRVGIGTRDPVAALHVHGNSDNGDDDCQLVISDADTTAGSKIPSILFRSLNDAANAYVSTNRIRGTKGFGMQFSTETSSEGNLGTVMTLDNNQRVGIGTIIPQGLLQVNGAANITGEFRTNGAVGINGAAPDSILQITNADSSSYRFGYGGTSDIYLDADDVYFRSDNGGANQITKKGGSLGIGVVNPSGLLHVVHNGFTLFENNVAGANLTHKMASHNQIWQIAVRESDKASAYVIRDETAGVDAFAIEKGGNVGIGTTNPARKLEIIQTTNQAAAAFESRENGGISVVELRSKDLGSPTAALPANQGPALAFQGYNGSSFQSMATIFAAMEATAASNDMPSSLRFLTTPDGSASATEKMRITSAGNVGIGTDTPSAKLHITSDGSHDEGAEIVLRHDNNNTTDVVSTISFQNNGGQVAMIQGQTVGSSNNGVITFNTDDAGTPKEAMRIDSSQNVGIGTTIPRAKLDVNGDASITGELKVSIGGAGILAHGGGGGVAGGFLSYPGGGINAYSLGMYRSVTTNSSPDIYDQQSDSVIIGAISNQPTLLVHKGDGTLAGGRVGIGDFRGADPQAKLVVSGAAVVGGITQFTAGGTHELSINLGVGDCLGIGASDSALNYIRRYSATNETLQLQTYAGANNGIFSMQPYGGEVHIGMGNGTAIKGSLLHVDGDVGVTGKLSVDDRIACDGPIICTSTVDCTSLGLTTAIVHDGDSDTKIEFTTSDIIDIYAGNLRMITIEEASSGADAVIINENSADINFRVESNGNANMLLVDGGENRVGIGTSIPQTELEVHGVISGVCNSNYYARFEHRDTDGGNQGTNSLGYNTRTVNTTTVNHGGFASLPGSNEIRLAAGEYYTNIEVVSSMGESFTELALHSPSTPTTVTTADGTSLQSVNTFGGSADFDNHIIKGIFKLSVQSDLIIRTFAGDDNTDDGFGRSLDHDSEVSAGDYGDDVYMVAEFWKIG